MTKGSEKQVVDINQLADHLKTDPRSLRAFLRQVKLGVGRGGAYGWPSLDDPAVKRIIKEWAARQSAPAKGPKQG